MRISRVYQKSDFSLQDTVTLEEWAIQHTVIALRLKPGFIIHLFNGREAGEYQAELVMLGRKQFAAKILSFIPKNNESPLHTHLGQAISRGDRMDFALQKAVELGINEITPLFTEHCAVKFSPEQQESRFRHWQNILISATEQSGRCFVPTLHPPQDLSDFIQHTKCDINIIFDPQATQTLKELTDIPKSVSFIIGPEGGLSDSEVALCQQHSFISLRCGPRIVRTETATLLALSLLQAKWGDF